MSLRTKLNELYYEISKNELRSLNEEFPDKITYTSLLYLKLIAFNHHATVSSLVRDTKLPRANIVARLKLMEKQDLIYQEYCADCEFNQAYYRLTPKSQAYFKVYNKAFVKAIEASEKIFSRHDLYNFEKVLNHFIDLYQEYRFSDLNHFDQQNKSDQPTNSIDSKDLTTHTHNLSSTDQDLTTDDKNVNEDLKDFLKEYIDSY